MKLNRGFRSIVNLLFILGALGLLYLLENGSEPDSAHPGVDNGRLETAIANRHSDVQVEGEGTVIKLLRDDLKGSRHQRFLVRLDSGNVILIAHNIDLAPRVDSLREGERIAFFGEYEWNDKGGVVHWTHHDPGQHHPDGWLNYEGRIYQ